MRTFWERQLTPEEETEMIDKLAMEIKKRKMEAPAILVLESCNPFANVIGHGMIATSPFLAPLVGFDKVDEYSQLLGNRKSLARLIHKLEESEPQNEVQVDAMD